MVLGKLGLSDVTVHYLQKLNLACLTPYCRHTMYQVLAYRLNIDLNGKQEPDTWYDDNMVLGKLGLAFVNNGLLHQINLACLTPYCRHTMYQVLSYRLNQYLNNNDI